MANATANGLDILEARIHLPRRGRWWANLAVNTDLPEKLTGTVQISGSRVNYRQLQLSSGPMNASGSVDVNEGALAGSVSATVGTKTGTVVASGTLGVTGTVKDPVLR